MTATLNVESAFPEPGKVFAERYEIERLLGTGGHSRVFAATQTGFDRRVAVKVLTFENRGDRAGRETLEKRFYREARLLSRLRGPHTLRVYDYGRTETGQLFMVSELVPGTDLRELLRTGGPISERRSRRIFTQILQGLMEVHAEGFLHRDIKPSNVMIYEHLGTRDHVKLLDFGIAKATELLDDEAPLTRAGFVIGTPGYMSPEQALGHELLESSDVFSAALVVYEMLTGRAPYVGFSLDKIQRSVKASSPRLPATLDISADFAAVIHRCLETDSAKRYAAAADVLRDLGIAPDTVEIPAAAEPAPMANVLTFPMHVDYTGTTRIDTLTDAKTGETTSLALPDTGPSALDEPSSVEAPFPEVDIAAGTSPDRKSIALVVVLAVLVIAAIGWLVVGSGESGDEPSAADPAVGDAVRVATDSLSRSVRNAELDAQIAAKEAALEAEESDVSDEAEVDEMEFEAVPDEPVVDAGFAEDEAAEEVDEEPDTSDSVDESTSREPTQRKRPRRVRRANPAPEPKPEPKPEPRREKPKFEVKMVDDL